MKNYILAFVFAAVAIALTFFWFVTLAFGFALAATVIAYEEYKEIKADNLDLHIKLSAGEIDPSEILLQDKKPKYFVIATLIIGILVMVANVVMIGFLVLSFIFGFALFNSIDYRSIGELYRLFELF